MPDETDLPFKAEYSKSNRAACKKCKEKIEKDVLRMAVMVQSYQFDGKTPNWFHYECFWDRARPKDVSEVFGLENLRWEDQEKVKENIAKISSGDMPEPKGAKGKKGAGGGTAVKGKSSGAKSDFGAEYAVSGGSTCKGCAAKIAKGEVRLGRMNYEDPRAVMHGPFMNWNHVDCFVARREELSFTAEKSPTIMTGFMDLREKDRNMLFDKLGKGDKKASSSSKRKSEDDEDANGVASKKLKTEKADPELAKALEKQTKMIWKIRDKLRQECNNSALKELLDYNNQFVVTSESDILDACADLLAFGAMRLCPDCKKRGSKEGKLRRNGNEGYSCQGYLEGGFTKCQYATMKPERKAVKIPSQFKDVSILAKYKYTPLDRVFPPFTGNSAASTSSTPVVKQEVKMEVKTEPGTSNGTNGASTNGSTEKGPLHGMKFTIVGNLSKVPNIEMKRGIEKLGGLCQARVEEDSAACFATQGTLEEMGTEIKRARKFDVQVLSEDFLAKVQDRHSKGKSVGVPALIVKMNIADWGSDPNERIGDIPDSFDNGATKSAAERMFVKSGSGKQTMKVKGGAVVDPDSGLVDSASVWREGKDIYSVILNAVDVQAGKNSYYKLQVLKHDKKDKFHVFRSWGRIGTTIGDHKLEKMDTKMEALKHFKMLYEEKTGNVWENRANFVKQPKRFFPVDLDFGEESEEVKKLSVDAGKASKLAPEVQELVRLIFDVERMKQDLIEFEIDLKKMPLGKLSKSQIQAGYQILNEALAVIDSSPSDASTLFLDATNRFFTIIPHDFGMNNPPLLDNKEIIASKTQMLDSLMDMEIAYNLLKSDGGAPSDADPIDAHYAKLNTDISVIPKDSEGFKTIQEYVQNTHGETHSSYTLDIEQVFKVNRKGEGSRFKPFKQLHRQLLWHGSRVSNYAGILSTGLRIAPPEAPVTGYMFGKGLYFADMVSKSANYTHASKQNPTGLMLLCDVALGNMHELKHADFITKLPKGKQSCKGIGKMAPNADEGKTTKDGVVIPSGKWKKQSGTEDSSLLYNEFIVYDVGQVNIKYLLKLKFNYKY